MTDPRAPATLATADTQVPRSPVCDRICHAGGAKLVLVRAPAGFGKTTAMQQSRALLEARGIDTAWLTLDRADNDVSRFLGCLGEALAPIAADDAGRGSPLDALARHAAPFALFLDDFEMLQEPAVLGLLREIVDRLPRLGQLVIGSRALPELGLGRLRARGQLVEVDADHLRFSADETAEFFARRGAPLAAPQVARLHARTEGWVAALWLASMAIERHGAGSDFIDRFSGSNRAIADYLAEDVLAHQGAEVREFLLRTSVLRHLTAPLCQALVPRQDCARVLDELEAANVFVTPIAGEDGSWRYHSLFAEFLQARLRREQPDEFARLNLAAAGWYEIAGRPVPAIDHALDGGDFPYALQLLSQHAEAFVAQGRMRLLARWFAAVPAGALEAHPLLQAIAVWASCFTEGPWAAMARLDACQAAGAGDPGVQAHLRAQRPLLLAMMDRYEDAYAAGRDGLARLPSCKPFADSVLTNAMASVVSVMGETREAHRLLDSARAGRGTSAFVRTYTESMDGLLDLQEGRLRQATARFRLVLTDPGGGQATSYPGPYHHSGNAWAGVLYAMAIYEANQLQQAEHLLSIYLPLASDVGLPDHMIASHAMRSRIAFQRGDVDAAVRALTDLEYLGHQRQLPRVVCSAKLERARMLTLQGNAQAASEELARADDSALWQRVERQRLPAHETDDMATGRLRWEIRFGDIRQALPRLEREIAHAENRARHSRALKLRVLLALAQQRGGDPSSALRSLDAALRIAAPEGFMRVFLDEGPAVAGLLHRLRAQRQEPGAALGDPLFDDYLQRLAEAAGTAAHADTDHEPPATPGAAAGAAELTRKEIRVLELLAEGYSNGAMAEKLFVSESTVRTHLRNINAKLDARSRTQAVAIARRLGVIG